MSAPQHSDPTKPRHDRKSGQQIEARAPYNFVPLPSRVVPAPANLPDHDAYHIANCFTGWIDCELETCSPTYIRGMLNVDVWRQHREKKQGDVETDAPEKPGEVNTLTDEQKEQAAPFFSLEEEPLIPGSSLRGMIRALVEIIGYGRVRWVGATPTVTYRMIATEKDNPDPLHDPYQAAIGRFGSNVRAGYLVYHSEGWYIRPAPTHRAGKPSETYLKVKDRRIGARDIPGLIRFDSSEYKPQLHPVSFNTDVRLDKRNKEYVAVTEIGAPAAGLRYNGYLVCTGNMLETGDNSQTRSPRKSYALVMGENTKIKELPIPPQVVKDYQAGLSPFERDAVHEAWTKVAKLGANVQVEAGCLVAGMPVFYITENEKGKEQVRAFGHCPNFRIPAWLGEGERRAATPLDLVPPELRTGSEPDLVDAIFGWVQEKGFELQESSRAGRVFFSDARCIEQERPIWYREHPITPHVLSTPKPTTFQHYLVQDREAGHDPDLKKALAHYGTPPSETTIRGHKLYWHKGADPDIEATAKEREPTKQTQTTRIRPVRPGVCFQFRVRFENLRSEELGALWWALALPGEEGKPYHHKIGMGKPLGMGSVRLTPRLFLTDRADRYRCLFNEQGAWEEGVTEEVSVQPHLTVFETYVLQKMDQGERAGAKKLRELPRIQALLAMLEWREGQGAWQDLTRYMEIERGADKINEYKERPVLAGPLVVSRGRLVESVRPLPAPPSATVARPPAPNTPPKHRERELPSVGDTFTEEVLEQDETAVKVRIPSFSPQKVFGLLRAEQLGEKRYRVRDRVAVEVVGITPLQDGRTRIELKLGAKKGKKK